jgi:hypothetical protein
MPTLDDLFSEKKKPKSDVSQLVLDSATKYQLEPGLLHAMIRTESAGNPLAVSNKGAQGLMQLMPGTAKQMGVTDPFDPAQNIDAGAHYFRQQLDKYGDVPTALAAYNFGPRNIDQKKPLPKETRDYVEKITKKAGIEQSDQPISLDELFAQRDRGAMAGSHTYPTSQTGAAPGAGADLLQMGKQMALPVLGDVIGTGLGVAAAPFVGPAAIPLTLALRGGFSAGGEYLNQRLGITEPSAGQIALQGAIPTLFAAAAHAPGGLRAGAKITPPSTRGAEFLNRIGAEETRLHLGRLQGPDPGPLFQRVAQAGGSFHTGGTMQAIQQELGNLTQSANGQTLYGRTIDVLNNLQNKLIQSGGSLSPMEFQAELRDLGAAMRTAEGRTVNKVEQGALKKVYGQLAEALDVTAQSNMPNGVTARELLDARKLVKRQSVLDDIEESLGNAEKLMRGQGDNIQFNANAVLRDLKNNPFWTGAKGGKNPAFTAQEKKEFEELLTLMNKLPALQPGAGVNAGSMRKMQRGMMAGSAGTAGGLYSGGDPMVTAAAAAAGAAIPTLAAFGRVVGIALRTETGRKELRGLLRQPGITIPDIVGSLSAALTASQASPPPQFTAGPTAMPTPFSLEP